MSQEEKIGVSKFKNIMGITCYMNSILHILQEIPAFQDYILKQQFVNNINKDKLDNSIVFELYKLFKVSSENNDAILTPKSFKHRIGEKYDMWNEYQQQDSQEFLTFLISNIEEEVGLKLKYIPGANNIMFNISKMTKLEFNKIINNISAQKAWFGYQLKEYSSLKKMFDGLIKTNKRCSYCNNIQCMFEPYITLGISIPLKGPNDNNSYTLTDCLDSFTHEERLTHDNQSTCEFCGVKNRFYSQSKLWHSPDVLIIHIKRFTHDSKKINNNVEYPINDLDIIKYFDENSPYKHQSKYNLCGINVHLSIGSRSSIHGGHYISIIKNKINNNWYLYNDSNSLVKVYDSESDIRNLQNSNAYILFYTKV